MKPENLVCFSQPHWLLKARGMELEPWLKDGVYVGTGGITRPQPVDLHVGHKYYRFASNGSPRDAQLGGGWWLEFDTFNTIRVYAERNDLRLGHAARLFLALPLDWTRVDRLVSATLAVPLRAYAGKGAVAESKDGKWTPIQHLPVSQLYIPGLMAAPPSTDHLYKKAFPNPQIEMIANR